MDHNDFHLEGRQFVSFRKCSCMRRKVTSVLLEFAQSASVHSGTGSSIDGICLSGGGAATTTGFRLDLRQATAMSQARKCHRCFESTSASATATRSEEHCGKGGGQRTDKLEPDHDRPGNREKFTLVVAAFVPTRRRASSTAAEAG